MHKPKERGRAVSPSPTYMSNSQMSMHSRGRAFRGATDLRAPANFLQDLRTNRPTRPVGSRPPPAHFSTWSARSSPPMADQPIVSPIHSPTTPDAPVEPAVDPPAPEAKHRRSKSNMSIDEVLAGTGGRALVQPPRGRDISAASTSRERTPSMQYRESSRRQGERDEARELRIALEELDLMKEEKLYNAARDEAAELVWKHMNPHAPGNEVGAPYAYPGLARKMSQQRSRSVGRNEGDLERSTPKLQKRNSMGSSAGSRSSSLQGRRAPSGSSNTAIAGFSTSPTKQNFIAEEPEESTALPKISSNPSNIGGRRRGSGSKRRTSGTLFRNPNDQIYEEPEEEAQPSVSASAPAPAPAPAPVAKPANTAAPYVSNPPPPAPVKVPFQPRRNPFSRVQMARDNFLSRSHTDPGGSTKPIINRVEIHRNEPSQSRNAAYTSNRGLPGKLKPVEVAKPADEEVEEVKMKDGKEIRGDDIRAATGFKLKDRSAKLPTPSIVSDRPGRPIVSFKTDWKPKEVEMRQEVSPPETDLRPRQPAHASTAPTLPTINFPEEPQRNFKSPSAAPIPSINVSSDTTRVPRRSSPSQVPVINIYEDPPARPTPSASASRKVNTPSFAAPTIPTINVSQTIPTRPKPSPTPPVPRISVQETPSISFSPAEKGSNVRPPSRSAAAPIPTFSFNEPPAAPRTKVQPPSISVSPSVPAINVNAPPVSTRPLPDPKNASSRGFSRPFQRNNTANINNSHWTPTAGRSGVLCTQCMLPISGRIVSAAGNRFHPECFQCHLCGERLECVAFYPEPENKYTERVLRIQARQRGDDIEFLPTHPTHDDMMRLEQEDGDESMRFFCHLDFHEQFSPRCKSCKTPIEGEVVVACGAEWHVGHFFCAQCGDPFDSSTPFVEKDGYAWCVGCHTNRYSAKCRKCKKPVVDTVVKALGAEWHMNCFCCVECSGPFQDGRYFLRGDSQDPVCVKCEERRLKA